ncbi:MAG: methylmalonyl Co-A mutase-associated GTPase MeaB [Bacteroidetes bacterium]|nr:MAG: methylmalonyl Co-A mutase-associated GTPase MeaB [Bacteroidota bacterium]
MPRRKRLSPATYTEGVLAGDRVRLSQAITLVESSLDSDRELAREVIRHCMPHTGGAFRIGITGVPGVGKSTFIDAFGTYLTQLGHKVAVLAVDPSSQLSRGSILGDKTRMERLSHDPNAYVRPSPTGGSLGGVARKTRETLLLCEAAGFDVILIETVGVGQSEVTVASMVDFFLLLMLPNAGDELQGIKKGIMEMADAILINKADGAFLPKARLAKVAYGQALRLFPQSSSGWRPAVQLCSAQENQGIDQAWDLLSAYRQLTTENGYWQSRREAQALQWMEETIQHQLTHRFYAQPAVQEALPRLEAAVKAGETSPIEAAAALLETWQRSS